MDELQEMLHELHTRLSEAAEVAHRAAYLARRLGLAAVDQQIEEDLLPALLAFADDDLTATQAGSVGQLLALLEAET